MGQNSQPLSEVVRSGWVPTSFIHSLIQSLPFMSSRVHAFVVHRALICSLSFASNHVISSHVTPRHVMPCSIQLLSVHSFIFSTHTHKHTHTLLNDTHLTRATLGANFAGRDAIVCMQRLLKRTGFWTAPIVRIDLLAAPMPAAGGKTAANQADRANIVPKLGGSRVASHAC